jgi:hypothetical protein
MLPTSRKDAKAQGLARYCTGKPCVNGHLEYRQVSNGTCSTCAAANRQKFAATKPEARRAIETRSYKKRAEKIRAAARSWRAANPELVAVQKRRERERNAGAAPESARAYKERNKAHLAKLAAEYRRQNKGRVNAHTAARKCRQMKATPPWADLEAIASLYAEGAASGMDVDHVIPLKGKLVSGLHVETNLRLLPPTENNKKYNKFDPT